MGETILVVDDDPHIIYFLAKKVLPSMGYNTLSASDGKSALQILRSLQPSLLLIDLQLPDMTGLDLLRQLEREGYRVPTILNTAHGSEEIAIDAFRLGVQDYLAKPLNMESLNQAITRALNESRLRSQAVKLTEALEEQVAWMTALAKVGQSLASTLELDEVLRRIVEAGVQLTHAEEGFLALLDAQGRQLYLRAVKNIDQEKIDTMHLPVNDTLLGEVIHSQEPLRTTSSAQEPPLKVSTGFLVYSLLHVPILSKGKSQGVLSVVNHSSKMAFTEKDEELLISLADYAAVAIENARLYEQAQQEIAERKRVELALRESEERYALSVRGANDGLWDWNLRNNQIYYSPRWKSMLGYAEEDIADDPNEWLNRIHLEDIERTRLDISAHLEGVTSHFENEHRILHKDGTYRWMLSRGLVVRDAHGLASRMAGSQTDITDRKHAEQKLLRDAFYDTLTGLANRALFLDRLKQAIERSKRHKDYSFAVLFLDLDRFKDVNDSLGHSVGDQLLIKVANLLQSGLRTTDTVARLGGDEFVILIEDVDLNNAAQIADDIQTRLASSIIKVQERELFVTTSIGIVLNTPEYNQPEDVLRDADIAMYVAKGRGKARFEVFDPAMRQRIMERLALEADLRQAIERQEFVVYYQPIVSLISGRLVGFEALVRWQHPERGLLQPAEFIPLAESTGLIIPIDRWVLRVASRQIIEWQSQVQTDPPLTISVNFSTNQISQPDTVEQIEKLLQETSLDPHCLKLEMTESAIMENNQNTRDVLKKIQALGVGIQIDDFGTGYSSLGYLHQFPVNALKIDRSFVSCIDSPNSSEIAQTVVMLAHDLKMEAVAEGVETEEQLALLKNLGCEYIQGSFICDPVDKSSVNCILAEIRAGRNPFIGKRIPIS